MNEDSVINLVLSGSEEDEDEDEEDEIFYNKNENSHAWYNESNYKISIYWISISLLSFWQMTFILFLEFVNNKEKLFKI